MSQESKFLNVQVKFTYNFFVWSKEDISEIGITKGINYRKNLSDARKALKHEDVYRGEKRKVKEFVDPQKGFTKEVIGIVDRQKISAKGKLQKAA